MEAIRSLPMDWANYRARPGGGPARYSHTVRLTVTVPLQEARKLPMHSLPNALTTSRGGEGTAETETTAAAAAAAAAAETTTAAATAAATEDTTEATAAGTTAPWLHLVTCD